MVRYLEAMVLSGGARHRAGAYCRGLADGGVDFGDQAVAFGRYAAIDFGAHSLVSARRRRVNAHHDEETSAEAASLETEYRSKDGLPRYLWICIGVIAASYAVFAVNLASSYPTGWDALAYHLPAALRWIQTGTMSIPSYGAWQYALPGNAEIGMMLLLSTGRQWLVRLVNLFAAFTMAMAIYLIAHRITLRRGAAEAAAILALSLPIVEFQAFSAYVDLFGTAFCWPHSLCFCTGETPGYRRRQLTPLMLKRLRPRWMLVLSGVGVRDCCRHQAHILCVCRGIVRWRRNDLDLGKRPPLARLVHGNLFVCSGCAVPSFILVRTILRTDKQSGVPSAGEDRESCLVQGLCAFRNYNERI